MIDRADARLFLSTFPITGVALEAAFLKLRHGVGCNIHRQEHAAIGDWRKIYYK
jgi:hypothetical protein